MEYSKEIADMNLKNIIVYHCDLCNFKTSSMFFKVSHAERHHFGLEPFNCKTSDVEIYRCLDCNFTTNMTVVLKRHIRERHLRLQTETRDRSYQCRKCNLETYSLLCWYKHVTRDCVFTRGYKRFECQKCNYSTNDESNFNKHNVIHVEEWFSCRHRNSRTRADENSENDNVCEADSYELAPRVPGNIEEQQSNVKNRTEWTMENTNPGDSTDKEYSSFDKRRIISESNDRYCMPIAESSCSSCFNESIDDTDSVSNIVKIGNNSNEGKIETIGKKSKIKVIRCKFCRSDIATKNFTRHIQRHHPDENRVRKIFQLPKNSKERRQAFSLLRNETNFDLFIQGVERPNRKSNDSTERLYVPCPYCKGLFVQSYLRRHAKNCNLQKHKKGGKTNYLGDSQTLAACAMDPTKVISKMNVKNDVFSIMKGDDIAFEAKKDLLIAHFGESYLKKHSRERLVYTCSNRMRELSRLLIRFREITNDKKLHFKDMLSPKHFDNVVLAARQIAGYDHEKKVLRAPTLAKHLGTSLKLACDELVHLILRESDGYTCQSLTQSREWLRGVRDFKELVWSRWNTELAVLVNNALMENTLSMANECKEQLPKQSKEDNEPNKSQNRGSKKRIGWANEELHLLKKEFGCYINKGTYPPGEKIKVFLAKTGIQRTVMVVKSKIQHLHNKLKKIN